jgi:riboflavin synthase
MFSGIVEAMGEVALAESRQGGVRLAIRVPESLRALQPGSSLAINGVCLTVVERAEDRLVFDAVGATLQRTLIGRLCQGDRVNLERTLGLGAPVDGHLVTGHVDGVGEVVRRSMREGAVFMDIRMPEEIASQVAPRGSIAVDGVSLTVADVRDVVFVVSIVPYTLSHTILGDYKPGRRVHLETDVLAKYVERALGAREGKQELGAWLSEPEKRS